MPRRERERASDRATTCEEGKKKGKAREGAGAGYMLCRGVIYTAGEANARTRGAFDGVYFLRFVRSLDSGFFRGDAGGDEGFGFSRVLDARLGVLSQTTDDALKFAEKGALLFFVWGFDGG